MPDAANLSPDDYPQRTNPVHETQDESLKALQTLPSTEVIPPPQPHQELPTPPFSKNQLKKQKRHEDWEASRSSRKAKRKEKFQQKKLRKRTAREQTLLSSIPSPSNSVIDAPQRSTEEAKKSHSRRPVQLPITFIIDCGFDELMLEKERVSLAAQVTRCYSDNHKAPFRAHLAVSSFGGLLRKRFEGVLAANHLSWKGVWFLDGDFVAAAAEAEGWMGGDGGGKLAGVFEPVEGEKEEVVGEVVYLTSDSPFTLTELRPYSTYIIGGLVDRNRYKGICYKRAMDHGFRTAKLPIGDYMLMNSRFVLATNHVAEIMLRWLEVGEWGEAFERVVPKRKGGVLRGRRVEGSEVDGDGEERGEADGDGEEGGEADGDGEDGGEVDAEVSEENEKASPEAEKESHRSSEER